MGMSSKIKSPSSELYDEAREILSNKRNYDPSAMGYVYCLYLTPVNDSRPWKYIGQTTDLVTRLKEHIEENGNFAKPRRLEDGTILLGNASEGKPLEFSDLELIHVRSIHGDECSDENLRYRLRMVERELLYHHMKRADAPRVLGGI